MTALDLLYTRPIGPTQPLELVFGDDELPGGAVGIEASGRITGLRIALTLRAGVSAVAQGRISGLRLHMGARADINCDRPTVGQTGSLTQYAQPLERGAQAAQQQAAPLPAAVQAVSEEARGLRGTLRTAWEQARALRAAAGVVDQQALALPAWLRAVLFEDAARLRTGAAARFEQGAPARAARTQRFEDAERLRDGRRSRFEPAQRLHGAHLGGAGYGRPVRLRQGGRFQEAWPPRAGSSTVPPPQPRPPCFSPALPLQLVFSNMAGAELPLALLYVCGADAAQPPVVVPVRRVYIVLNNVTLRRASDDAAVPVFSLALSIDVESFAWSFSAEAPLESEPLVVPSGGGAPVELIASVNTVSFRLLAESLSRERTFGKTRVRVAGRSHSAALATPYAAQRSFTQVADRTAQQLMNDALTLNGAPLGWAVDWGLTDWLVPAGTFTHQGSPMSAVQAIAAAAGGYVQPHRTAQTLRIRHRYPVARWAWSGVAADVLLPAAVTVREGLQWVDKPVVNRVYVSGETAGVLGQVTRAGTAGDALAPMVVERLITHADAARQRGTAVLSDSGRAIAMTLSLPVLPETGVIEPGVFVQYQDGSTERIGLVRSTQIDARMPEVRQTIGVEVPV